MLLYFFSARYIVLIRLGHSLYQKNSEYKISDRHEPLTRNDLYFCISRGTWDYLLGIINGQRFLVGKVPRDAEIQAVPSHRLGYYLLGIINHLKSTTKFHSIDKGVIWIENLFTFTT